VTKELFIQIYYLRKFYGRRSKPLATEIITRLGQIQYVIYWIKHKTTRLLVVTQFAVSVGRASSRAGLGAPKQSGGGSSVASPHQNESLPDFS
jgi:hypothetical protein